MFNDIIRIPIAKRASLVFMKTYIANLKERCSVSQIFQEQHFHTNNTNYVCAIIQGFTIGSK